MKINEFVKLQQKQKYKHIALYDKLNKCRVRFNGQKNSSNDKLETIKTRLQSEIYNDDYYIIKCKNYHTDTETDDFIIHLNETNKNTMQDNYIPQNNNITMTGYSFEKSLSLEVEVKKLQIENQNLALQILDLKEDNENLIKTLDECDENENLGEDNKADWKVFLTESLTTLAPLLDKHFELKERNIKIKELQMQKNITPGNLDPNSPPQNGKVQNKFNEKILEELNTNLVTAINSLEDLEQKEKIMNIYNNSTDLNECLKEIHEINNDLVENLMTSLND